MTAAPDCRAIFRRAVDERGKRGQPLRWILGQGHVIRIVISRIVIQQTKRGCGIPSGMPRVEAGRAEKKRYVNALARSLAKKKVI